MELRPGYKRTEVGVIPEDWPVEQLGQHASFRTGPFGSSLHKSDYKKYGIPIINPMHIADGELRPSPEMAVDDVTARRLSDFRLQSGEIVIGRRGEIGRCAVVRDAQAGWLCGTGSMIVRPNDIHSEYLQRILSSTQVVEAIQNASVGSTMVNLNQGSLSSLFIPFPSQAEQRAIATALSDVDALLDALDRLIAKKRDLKQAAMQQLLTGQTRLPGFGGKWELRCLGDHLIFLKNGSNSRADLSDKDPIKYLHYGDIHGSPSVLLNPATFGMPSISSEKVARLDRLTDGDLVFADASEDLDGVGKSVELHGIKNVEVVSGLHTIAVRFDKLVLADGFKAYLQFVPAFLAHLRRHAAGTKVLATNKSYIASAEVSLPNTAEQTAIATVLSDMDAELQALEARRDKIVAIKQGMMQELLTGRTRLI